MLNAAVRQGLRSLSAMGIACCRTATTAAAIFRDDAGSMRMRRKKLRSVCKEPLTRRSVTDGMAHPSLLAQRPASTALRDPSSFTDVHLFLRAVALALPRGLQPNEIHSVEARWQCDEPLLAGGFILNTLERGRIYLEYRRDEARAELWERIVVEPLPNDTLYPRPAPGLPTQRWSTHVEHLNLRLPKSG